MHAESVNGSDLPGPLLDSLRGCLSQARARYPEIEVDDSDYFEFVAGRIGDWDDFRSTLEKLHTSDLFLALAAGRHEETAVRVFELEIMSEVPKVVRRTDSSKAFVDEVTSRTRVRLLVGTEEGPPRVFSYHGGGPLRSFAMVVGMREASAQLRREKRRVCLQLDQGMHVEADLTHPEVRMVRERGRNALKKAVVEAFSELSNRERAVLQLYYGEDVSSENIGKMYNVHRATVARWLTSARDKVLKNCKRETLSALDLPRDGFESLINDFTSDFDITLGSVLRAAAE